MKKSFIRAMIILCFIYLVSCTNNGGKIARYKDFESIARVTPDFPYLVVLGFNKPKNILVAKHYNKSTKELSFGDQSETIEVDVEYRNSKPRKITLTFKEIGFESDELSNTEYVYLVSYDSSNRISKIVYVSKTYPVVFDIYYEEDTIKIVENKETNYFFDFNKHVVTSNNSNRYRVETFTQITANDYIDIIIHTPQAQESYHELIYKYDSLGRLVLYINNHFEEPSDYCDANPWNHFYYFKY